MFDKLVARFRAFIANSKHILNVSYKPNSNEFSRSAKIILLGIILIGVMGFLISLVVQFITGTAI